MVICLKTHSQNTYTAVRVTIWFLNVACLFLTFLSGRFFCVLFVCLFSFKWLYTPMILHINIDISQMFSPGLAVSVLAILALTNIRRAVGAGTAASPKSLLGAAPMHLPWGCTDALCWVHPAKSITLQPGSIVSYLEIFSLQNYSGTCYSLSQAVSIGRICMTIEMWEILRSYNICMLLEHLL